MNEHLVSIKVDREERPDVDAVYMTATQAMTGQGGWPMTVFMTPDREPFYCGTYFPREQFQRLVLGVADAWRQDRGGVTGQAKRIAAALAEQMSAVAPGGGAPGQEALAQAGDAALAGLEAGYDAAARRVRRRAQVPAVDGARVPAPPSRAGALARSGGRALRMAAGTLEAMARGGMYDQLAGGFARYSVDADWVVPHFEKMLYDNALLARVYAHWWRRTGSELARRVAADTCAWMIAELRTAEGGFAAALDADSEGEEGKFYAWTPGQLREVLGPSDGPVRGRGVRRDPRGHVRARRVGAAASRRPGGRRSGSRGSVPRCWPRGRGGSARPGTTRSSRPGTAWPSRRWPRRACCWSARSSSRRPAARPGCWPGRTWPAAGWPAPRATGSPAPARACWRTTPAWPRATWPCPG